MRLEHMHKFDNIGAVERKVSVGGHIIEMAFSPAHHVLPKRCTVYINHSRFISAGQPFSPSRGPGEVVQLWVNLRELLIYCFIHTSSLHNFEPERHQIIKFDHEHSYLVSQIFLIWNESQTVVFAHFISEHHEFS
jgi:hypothetical protein